MPRPVPRQESWSALTPDGDPPVRWAPSGSSARYSPARFWLISGALHLLLFVAVSFLLRDTSAVPLVSPLKVTVLPGDEAASLLDDVSVMAQAPQTERHPLPPDLTPQTTPAVPGPALASPPLPPPILPERSPPLLPPKWPTPTLIEAVPELKTLHAPPPLRPPPRPSATERSSPETSTAVAPMAPPPPIVAQTPAPRPPQMAPTRDIPRPSRPPTTFDDALVARVPPTTQQRPNPPGASTPAPHAADAMNPPPRPPSAASPRYGQNPAPTYPSEARRRGWEGTVLLSVEILENGRPERITVKQSSGYAVLDEAALGAVRRWTFIPAQRNGQPIRSQAEVPIVFSLRKGR